MTLRAGYSLNSLAELRDIPPVDRDSRVAFRVASKNAWYGFNPLSTADDDNDLVIAPSVGTGRWEMMISATAGDGGGSGGEGDLTDRVVALENAVDSLTTTVSGLISSGGSGGLTPSMLGDAFARLFVYEGVPTSASYNSETDKTLLVFNEIDSNPIDTKYVVLEVRESDNSIPFTVNYSTSEGNTSSAIYVDGDQTAASLVASILRFPSSSKIQQWIEDEVSGG
jgi:hypothetical protein